nr:MAG TPA_asm: hypothetical protein [Caudoviricetes sp.]
MGIFSIKRARARGRLQNILFSLTFPIHKNPNSGQQITN